MYHFVSGFTLKLVGTEVGIIEPITSFNSCFGAAFMPHKMNVYAELLNTGWACGEHGEGKRVSIRDTRALLNAALKGVFLRPDTELVNHPVLNLRRRPHRTILGKSFSRHDLIRRVRRASSNMAAAKEYHTNVWVPAPAREHHGRRGMSVLLELWSQGVTCVSRTGPMNQLYVGSYWNPVA